MNSNIHEPKSKTELILLSLAKSTRKLSNKTKTKPQEKLVGKLTKLTEIFIYYILRF